MTCRKNVQEAAGTAMLSNLIGCVLRWLTLLRNHAANIALCGCWISDCLMTTLQHVVMPHAAHVHLRKYPQHRLCWASWFATSSLLCTKHQHRDCKGIVSCPGDGNCFYRAFVVGLLEELAARHTRRQYAEVLLAIKNYIKEISDWRDIDDRYFQYAAKGFKYIKVRCKQTTACVTAFMKIVPWSV